MAPGKGILAADESTATANTRLASVGAPKTEEGRRSYRELFLLAPGIEKYLSGVILFDETFRDHAPSGEPIPAFLMEKGIYPGIKVDEGLEAYEEGGEQVTRGIDGLEERLADYKRGGAAFAKWRSVTHIQGDTLPTRECLEENASRLAKYAKACVREGIVPILEPEVLIEGNHTRARSAEVIEEVLSVMMEMLAKEGVSPDVCIVKTSMALSGADSECSDTPEAVAEDTMEALRVALPPEVLGVVFLSGGQTPEQATSNLHAILRKGPYPWPVSFSYARALQEEALKVWGGKEENTSPAREAFFARLQSLSDV